jgi:hypothetical protein
MKGIIEDMINFFTLGNKEEEKEIKKNNEFEKGYIKITEKVNEHKKEFQKLYEEYQVLMKEKDIEKIRNFLKENKNLLLKLNELLFQQICKLDFLSPSDEKESKKRKNAIVQIQNILNLMENIENELQFILLIEDRILILNDDSFNNDKEILKIIKHLHNEAEYFVKNGDIEEAGKKGYELYKFRAKLNKKF